MDDEKRLAIIAEATISSAILVNLRPILDKQAEAIINSLKVNFREGKCDIVEMSSLVAQLCALDDIINKLSSKINKSERINYERK